MSASAAPSLPGMLRDNPRLEQWVRFDTPGRVTVSTGRVEIGQGVLTAMRQIAAEELDIPPDRILLQTGDTELTPNEGYTAGSQSIQFGGVALRQACAEVRALGGAEPLDRQHIFSGDRRDGFAAGFHGLAIDQHHAGATLLEPAAEFRAGKPEVVAQDVEQWRVRVGGDARRLAVHAESGRWHSRSRSLPAGPSRGDYSPRLRQ